ncbi:hypothetical protein CVT24_005870 [Panaeolus cyanescens]|uniref:Uncharacterized protein n=1 Tax=Panaeolus cyanescens TaxID=181874 RepID=A0A409YEY1_9AGAR|nr:hypothetical protein CVT24_005870 [Panaeolus cyanescens]
MNTNLYRAFNHRCKKSLLCKLFTTLTITPNPNPNLTHNTHNKRAYSTITAKAKRRIITLDPHKLSSLKQPLISLRSSKTTLLLPTGSSPVRYVWNNWNNIAFPPNSDGFFYYHLPPNRPALSAELRFRVTPTPYPDSFDDGYDLPLPLNHQNIPGPWRIFVACLPNIRHMAPVVQLLEHEGLLDPQLTRRIRELHAMGSYHTNARFLFNLEDPFMYRYSPTERQKAVLRPYTEVGQGIAELKMGHGRLFDKGTLKLRFEKSPLPEHSSKKILVVRCLDIPEPLVASPNTTQLELNAYAPVPGQLVQWCPFTANPKKNMTLFKGPWTVDVSDERETQIAKSLRLLW